LSDAKLTAMALGERIATYDPGENIASLSFKGVHLKTVDEVDAHFESMFRWWRFSTGSRKVCWLVNFDDFSVDLRHSERYAEHMRRMFAETAVAIVRYGGGQLQQAAVDLYSLRLHKSSNFYENREQALLAIRRIRAGTLKQGG
jgi:hypothetical protein